MNPVYNFRDIKKEKATDLLLAVDGVAGDSVKML
jgi:hypothetical protein